MASRKEIRASFIFTYFSVRNCLLNTQLLNHKNVKKYNLRNATADPAFEFREGRLKNIGGLGARQPDNFIMTMPFRLSENMGNALFVSS